MFDYFITFLFFRTRATYDMNLRHILLEKKNQHDIHSRKTREKDRDNRNLKKSELHLKVADEGLNHTRSIYEKLKSQVSGMSRYLYIVFII